ncbi:adenosine deaminase [Pseudooctadecabacter jejudonensis]|uniref:Adenine deaminase n=1 Tax=Pseudooctadecabacter jejudonensis TaxID=1391910 RepID=A0A1Y5SKG0_9RHOB|nr:adenosine deaminase [Pseudooctadecabacter jejudonensis]SLN42696.1 Adenine deaminase [Pseudooctadecabacter jejudonensis]
MTLRSYPKVELHTHLEGCAPPALVRDLAREKNIPLQGVFDAEGHYTYDNFAQFLKVYEAVCTTLQTPQDFYRLTRAVLEDSASHGVVYQEVFLCPDFCGGGDLAAWRDYLAAMVQAASEAERDFGITARGIVTIVRHFGADQGKITARCAAETAGDFITGFGMGGAEDYGRAADYAYAFDMAREAGLRLTSHVGEWGGPDAVAETLRDLRVERIGHGINARHDADLMRRIVDEGIVLEVCPISNIVLRAIPPGTRHPIDQLREAGARVTVSTDDPPFFHTTMTAEFAYLADTYGWGPSDFDTLNQTALAAAFCDDTTREAIAKRLKPEAQ